MWATNGHHTTSWGEVANECSPHTVGGWGTEGHKRPDAENPWILACGGHEGYSFNISVFPLSGHVVGWIPEIHFGQCVFGRTDLLHFLGGWNI